MAEIKPFGKGGVYTYLGVFESSIFDTAQIKTLLQQEFLKMSKCFKTSTECWQQG